MVMQLLHLEDVTDLIANKYMRCVIWLPMLINLIPFLSINLDCWGLLRMSSNANFNCLFNFISMHYF